MLLDSSLGTFGAVLRQLGAFLVRLGAVCARVEGVGSSIFEGPYNVFVTFL